jgi:hypothetical protein
MNVLSQKLAQQAISPAFLSKHSHVREISTVFASVVVRRITGSEGKQKFLYQNCLTWSSLEFLAWRIKTVDRKKKNFMILCWNILREAQDFWIFQWVCWSRNLHESSEFDWTWITLAQIHVFQLYFPWKSWSIENQNSFKLLKAGQKTNIFISLSFMAWYSGVFVSFQGHL